MRNAGLLGMDKRSRQRGSRDQSEGGRSSDAGRQPTADGHVPDARIVCADPQLYLFIKPLFRPPSTPPWSEALVYAILWTISLADVALALFLYSSNSHWPVWASPSWMAFEIANFAITSLLVYVVGGLPLASPEVFARVVCAHFLLPDTCKVPNRLMYRTWRQTIG